MHAVDIDLKRSGADGVRLLREYLDFAENGAEALQRSITVGFDDQFDSDFELEVCEFLREKGYVVDTQVGCSGYRIDLGLKKPNSSDYLMAIECDGAAYHSARTARERDRLRQDVLENMGWKIYRIWSTDWIKDPVTEGAKLLEAVEDAIACYGVVEEIAEDGVEHRGVAVYGQVVGQGIVDGYLQLFEFAGGFL
jgi:very-short-patch-repair endonuclease